MAVNDLTLGDPLEDRSAPPYFHHGICPFRFEHKIADADEVDENDDTIILYGPFGDGAQMFMGLNALRIGLPDLDTGAALVWDLGLGDIDGEIDTTLISGSTIGRSAGVDNLDANNADVFIDMTGKYLIFKVTTAPTGVPGAAVGSLIEGGGIYIADVHTAKKQVVSN